MTECERKALIEDFQQWSGGFPPESDYQITVYIDYALAKWNPEWARRVLQDWLDRE